jgi:hypothetical protein
MTQNAGQVWITCLAVFSWSQEWERKAKAVSSRWSGINFFIFSGEYTFYPVLSLNLIYGRWTSILRLSSSGIYNEKHVPQFVSHSAFMGIIHKMSCYKRWTYETVLIQTVGVCCHFSSSFIQLYIIVMKTPNMWTSCIYKTMLRTIFQKIISLWKH